MDNGTIWWTIYILRLFCSGFATNYQHILVKKSINDDLILCKREVKVPGVREREIHANSLPNLGSTYVIRYPFRNQMDVLLKWNKARLWKQHWKGSCWLVDSAKYKTMKLHFNCITLLVTSVVSVLRYCPIHRFTSLIPNPLCRMPLQKTSVNILVEKIKLEKKPFWSHFLPYHPQNLNKFKILNFFNKIRKNVWGYTLDEPICKIGMKSDYRKFSIYNRGFKWKISLIFPRWG